MTKKKIQINGQNRLAYILFLILTIGLISLIQSCTSVQPCKPNNEIGNLGAIFNSDLDEYSPVIFQNKLYYTALRKETGTREMIFTSNKTDSGFTSPVKDTILPLKYFESAGLPHFYYNPTAKHTELYFAAMTTNKGKISSDLFVAYLDDKGWSNPVPLAVLNTEHYESHPYITPDGSKLFFSSDRPGTLGNIDIYYSLRNPDGTWSAPVNAGPNINSPKNEIAPMLTGDGTLFFASNGRPGKGGYDIYRADKVNDTLWNEARPMPDYINSTADETGPFAMNDTMYYASNKRGGCGGMDLYTAGICGPVVIKGSVTAEEKGSPVEGTIYLLDESKQTIDKQNVLEDGYFEFKLKPLHTYTIRYFNSCNPNYLPEQTIVTPCSDSSTIIMKAGFVISTDAKKFEFGQYKVPFFVTGYYYPNTKDNLEALRLKFSYNLLGNDPKTKYIQKPGPEYDSYTVTVEQELQEAIDFIIDIINNLNDECRKMPNNKLVVKVNGFADPRAISPDAIYNDESVNDTQFGFNIEKGSPIDNTSLSTLRAYYTAKFLEKQLEKYPEYLEVKNRIAWEIEGHGIDESDKTNEEKRRVNIEIGLKKNG